MLNWVLALLSAALLILTFPRFHIVWFAPVALTPMLIAMAREARPWRRFLLGWASGVVYWFGVCYWIQFVLAFHGGMGDPVGWAVFLLFCVAKGLHMGVFALIAGILMRRWWAIPAVAAAWAAVEVTHGPLGFAWLALGNAGIDMGIPLRLAPITGVYGLSFVFMMMATALASAALRRPRLELLWLALLPLLFLLPPMPAGEQGHDVALLVQPDISETEEWTDQSVDRMEREQVALTARGALTGTDPPPAIVAWPEVPAPLYYYEDARFRNYVDGLARTIHAWLLVGIVAHRYDGAPLNSAVLVSPEGLPVSRYDKVNLVPFGEFVPWPLGVLTRKISTEAGDFAAGYRAVVSPVGNHKIAAFICYESVFPSFVRKFAEGGAEVLFNISNDGWFGKSAAREQHLTIVRMRAAENRRWILRATNDGITATIDPAGRLRGTLPLYTEGTSYTGFSYITATTVYTRWGDWFAWLCATIVLMALVAEWI
ncbi:MAG TPA: apolipoprotein N-acyltransferase [Bryobacteraceae bacterium]|nr:apolipoprotein N-acyltransferase [Bryobacteraceae bacterium]